MPFFGAHSTGAEMVSRYCQNAGDWKGAIEFLLMAKRTTDAFSLAKSHGQMDVFTKVYEVLPNVCIYTVFVFPVPLLLLYLFTASDR